MIGSVARNILRILFLVLLQGLVVNRLDLWQGYVLPAVYLFALFMLPVNTPRVLLLLIGFATGALVDAFTNTLGLHASAALLVAFLQPTVQRFLAPRDGYEPGQRPTIKELGLTWYIAYAGILILVHHTWLFFIELMRFTPFFLTLGKILLSSLATLTLLVLGQYLIYSPSERRNG
jgi:hypothetical protein